MARYTLKGDRDADFWHLPGTDDLACVRAQPEALVIVRVLTPRGREHEWRQKDVFSIWDTRQQDWLRNKVGHRKTWRSVAYAENYIAKIGES